MPGLRLFSPNAQPNSNARSYYPCAEAGLGDEAPHRVQLQGAVTSQPWCGPASPPPRPLTLDGRVQEEAAVAAGSVETLTPDLGLVT